MHATYSRNKFGFYFLSIIPFCHTRIVYALILMFFNLCFKVVPVLWSEVNVHRLSESRCCNQLLLTAFRAYHPVGMTDKVDN